MRQKFGSIVLFFLLVPTAFGIASQVAAAEAPAEVPGATTIGVSEAKALFDEGAVFIDVRNQMLYDAGHVKNALHIQYPMDFTEATLLHAAKKDQSIVVYCNGTHCGMSADAALAAVSFGYTKVYYFREGFPVWQAGGMPVK